MKGEMPLLIYVKLYKYVQYIYTQAYCTHGAGYWIILLLLNTAGVETHSIIVYIMFFIKHYHSLKARICYYIYRQFLPL